MSPNEVVTADPESVAAQRRIHARHVPAVSLAGTTIADRFCFWRGRSGRRYVFSVYRSEAGGAATLPSYEDAIVIQARRAPDGSRHAIRLGHTTRVPGLMATTCGDGVPTASAVDETHVHLLAGSVAERRALLSDLYDQS